MPNPEVIQNDDIIVIRFKNYFLDLSETTVFQLFNLGWKTPFIKCDEIKNYDFILCKKLKVLKDIKIYNDDTFNEYWTYNIFEEDKIYTTDDIERFIGLFHQSYECFVITPTLGDNINFININKEQYWKWQRENYYNNYYINIMIRIDEIEKNKEFNLRRLEYQKIEIKMDLSYSRRAFLKSKSKYLKSLNLLCIDRYNENSYQKFKKANAEYEKDKDIFEFDKKRLEVAKKRIKEHPMT